VRELNAKTDERPVAWIGLNELREPEWMIALLITLAALWFHLFFHAHAGAFWRDEVNTINVAAATPWGRWPMTRFPY
jgi:hypothetical protein